MGERGEGERGRFYGWIMGGTKRSINAHARPRARVINSNKYVDEKKTFSINAINLVYISSELREMFFFLNLRV